MQAAKEKISNMASAAKEHITICRAKLEERAEKATARTHEEREIAKERRKAKEAQAKMEFHQAKAKHAAQRLSASSHNLPGHHYHNPVPTATPYGGPNEPVASPTGAVTGTAVPPFPLGGGGHPHANKCA